MLLFVILYLNKKGIFPSSKPWWPKSDTVKSKNLHSKHQYYIWYKMLFVTKWSTQWRLIYKKMLNWYNWHFTNMWTPGSKSVSRNTTTSHQSKSPSQCWCNTLCSGLLDNGPVIPMLLPIFHAVVTVSPNCVLGFFVQAQHVLWIVLQPTDVAFKQVPCVATHVSLVAVQPRQDLVTNATLNRPFLAICY